MKGQNKPKITIKLLNNNKILHKIVFEQYLYPKLCTCLKWKKHCIYVLDFFFDFLGFNPATPTSSFTFRFSYSIDLMCLDTCISQNLCVMLVSNTFNYHVNSKSFTGMVYNDIELHSQICVTCTTTNYNWQLKCGWYFKNFL